MMKFTLECPIHDSFRVHQIEGMFDVPLSEKARQTIELDSPPGLSEQWQIGLIVGPSGSGKSSVARRVYGESLFTGFSWSDSQSVLDAFPDAMSIKEIIRLLNTVGFSSPPSWIKPYSVLSNGEKFRCDLAIALALGGNVESSGKSGSDAPLLAFDEFTSVVDRTVAMASCVALAKNIRSGLIHRRFLAITCHYDTAQWLEPDWVLDMADGRLERRRLRREPIRIDVVRCKNAAWELFKKHHYLSGSLSPMSVSYLAVLDGKPVGFAAILPLLGQKNRKRFTRLVVLPDYQGLGIGMNLAETIASLYRRSGQRINITASHPCVIGHCKHSPLWRAVSVKQTGSRRQGSFCKGYKSSAGRAVVSFEYIGQQIN